MPSDRPYLRGEYPRETTSVVTWLICAVTGAFLLQFVAASGWGPPAREVVRELAFSVENLAAGRVWTPFTHWLLHSTGNLFHVGVVLAGLFLLGRELMSDLGSRRVAGIFAASILTGAMAWGALNWRTDGTLLGATAGIYGLLTVYALLHPNREHNLLLFFFFPVTFSPKQLAIRLLIFDTFALVIVDLLGRPLPFPYAPSAHLGGMLAGWAYCRFFHEWDGRIPLAKRPTAQPHSSQAKTLGVAEEASSETKGRTREDIRQQTDRILDKINSQGFGALTPAERKVLDDAKELLDRR